ncbi:MAG: hypothetical protein FWC98_01970, partial [Bacteroidales bacterium]|nr:hypothetical protein [Bacteroidales bacterium]
MISLYCRKALQTVVLVFMLLFFPVFSLSSQVYLRDTVGAPPGEITAIFRDIVTCLNRELSGNVFTIALRIERSISMTDGQTWGDGDWVWPSPGWEILSATNVDGTWDEVVLGITYDFILAGNRNAILGGTFSVSESGWGTREVFIPLKPAATAVDTIFSDSILCQGANVVFSTRPDGNEEDTAYFESFERFYRWEIFDTSGGSRERILFWDDRQLPGNVSEFTINFDPHQHHLITVRRAFCNAVGVFGNPDHSAVLERYLSPENGTIPITNPPLDTLAGNRQDTLFRIAWTTPPSEGEEPAPPRWTSVPHEAPTCVNYGRQTISGVPGGFQRVLTEAMNDLAMFAGYIFFQVGTRPDTMVRYIWMYDTSRLERVFVGQPTDSNVNWWINDLDPRWRRVIDESEEEDTWTADNHGGFGQRRTVDDPYSEYSYRAAFRIRALPADSAIRWEDIIVSVLPECVYCVVPHRSPDGVPFQNDTLWANVGHPWDTVKPMNLFDIDAVRDFINFQSTSDTACINTVMRFRAIPHDAIRQDIPGGGLGLDWWNRDSLQTLFNISSFFGHSSHPAVIDVWTSSFAGDTVGEDERLRATADLNFTSPADVVSRWLTLAPQNRCFRRGRPTIAPEFEVEEGVFQLQGEDTLWHQIATYFVIPLAPRPLVIDPLTNIALDVGETVFICRNLLTDSVGNRVFGAEFLGTEYIFAAGTRHAGPSTPENFTLDSVPRLVRSTNRADFRPGVENFLEGSSNPVNRYFGFFNEDEEDGGFPGPSVFAFRGWDNYTPADGGIQQMKLTLRAQPDATGEGIFIFAAQDACGRGEPMIVNFVIIDTISAFDLLPEPAFTGNRLDPNSSPWENLRDDHLCEAEEIWYRIGAIPDEYLDRGGVRLRWTRPDSWGFLGAPPADEFEGIVWSQLGVRLSKDSGRVSVNVICDRCGGGRPIYTSLVEPIPYFRMADSLWIDRHPDVCQDSSYIFTIDRTPFRSDDSLPVELMGDFMIQFPNESWRIERNSVGAQPEWRRNTDTIRQDEFIHQIDPPTIWFDTRVEDSIGGFGNILIRWLDPRCDVYIGETTILRRPEFWDTTRVFTHTFPSVPAIRNEWSDTVCAGETIWFSVQPAPKDTLQNNHYIWTLPEGWEIVDSGARRHEDGTWVLDSVKVSVGPAREGFPEDTIRIEARSSRCDALGLRVPPAILKVPIVVWDTIVFDTALIMDLARVGHRFERVICFGDTVNLSVNIPHLKTYYLLDSVRWIWGPTGSLTNIPPPSGDPILGGWFFTNTEVLPDTLAIELRTGHGNESLFVQVTLHNTCGPTRSNPIELLVVGEDITYIPVVFSSYADSLCIGERQTFAVNRITYASGYVWNFPWAPYSDTIDGYSRQLTPMATGPIWVQAINSCDATRAEFIDTVRITKLFELPKAPIPMNFGRRTEIIDGEHWLFDTVCARLSYYDWRITLDPTDREYQYAWAPFQWMQLTGDTLSNINDFFAFRENDSVFNIRPVVGDVRRYNTVIGVAARRDRCPDVRGDTLRIALTSVDTIPLSRLGIIENNFPTSGHRPCPGTVFTFNVEHDSAFAYRWILPANDPTWRFANTDTTGGSVQIIIGENSARIGVVTTTGFDSRTGVYFCPFQNQDTLWSDSIRLFPLPVLTGFSEFPENRICAQTDDVTITVNVDPAYPAASGGFRFILHQRVARSTEIISDTSYRAVGTLVISPFADWEFDSVTVVVQAIDHTSCPTAGARYGLPITRGFGITNSPRVFLVGDTLPCLEAQELYQIVLSEPGVTFEFNYIAAPDVVVTTFPHGVQPQSLHVVFGGDSVRFRFHNIVIPDNVCPFEPRENIFTIITDTTPNILFNIIAPTQACMGDTIMLVVELEPDQDSVIEFIWDLPSPILGETLSWWRIYQTNARRDTVFMIAAEYSNRLLTRFDTIMVLARGTCGTSQIPEVAVVQLNRIPSVPQPLDWSDLVCLRDTVWFSVEPTPEDIEQGNYYVWTFPASWRIVDSTSNLDSVRVVVGPLREGLDVDTIRVEARSPCLDDPSSLFLIGESTTLRKPVRVTDTVAFEWRFIVDATRDGFSSRPCAGDTLILFVNKPPTVDSIRW